MEIICKFCNKEADNKTIAELKYHFEIYFCETCNAEYTFWPAQYSDPKPYNISLYTVIDGEMYRWSVSVNDQLASLWYIGTPGIPGHSVNTDVDFVKNFNAGEYHTVTPANIQNKLRVILLFL